MRMSVFDCWMKEEVEVVVVVGEEEAVVDISDAMLF